MLQDSSFSENFAKCGKGIESKVAVAHSEDEAQQAMMEFSSLTFFLFFLSFFFPSIIRATDPSDWMSKRK